ncbi:MAG: AMP-binding protein [Myxococcota bacterium]
MVGSSQSRPSPSPESDGTDIAGVLAVVRGLVVEVSDGRGLGQLTPDVSLESELGLGSLERVELAARVGDAFGVHLPAEAVASVDTPRQLLQQVHRAQGASGTRARTVMTPTDKATLLPTEPPVPEPLEASTLVEVLEYHVRLTPDRVHIVLEDDDGQATPITYRALHDAALAVARGLRQRGLAPGRSVAIMLPTGLGYFASFWGTLLAGGVPVPLYPPVRLDRIGEYILRCAKILDNAEAQVLITFDRAARVADIARDRVPSIAHVVAVDALLATDPGADGAVAARAVVGAADTALIQYTSGSTGDPKGVVLTQANVLANIRAAREACALSPEDIIVSWLPLYHDMGLIGGWLMPLYFGTPTVLMSPMAFLSKPERWLRALTEYKATASVAPNFAFDLCVKRIDAQVIEELDLHRVRSILNGSEPITVRTLERFSERFAPAGLRAEAIFCAYGLAENMVAVTFPPVLRAPRVDRIERETFERDGVAVPSDAEDALSFVGVGSPVPRHEIRIVDADGGVLGERRQGTVEFRGPSSFKGYHRRPDATAEVQRPDGWVDTGDLGYVADGELFISGRAKDLIIKGGRNYYPHEIEAAAALVKGIRQGCVAAFSVPDAASGTEQIVVIAETREADPLVRETLEAHVVEKVTAHVGVPPDRVVLSIPGAVPKTSSGKIRRAECRRAYVDGTINTPRKSAARQAATLYLGGLPARLGKLARRAAETAYGGYAATTLASFCMGANLAGRISPKGERSRRLAAAEARAGMTLAGLRPHVTGLSHIGEGAALLVANHSGYLDFLICLATLPPDTRFVIKGELRDSAFVGPPLVRMGHVFIDRHSAARSLGDLEEVTALLEAGQRVIVFPEGTFTADVGMRSFKLGAFRLACQTGTPVVPIAIRGSRLALRDGTWLPKHRRIEVEVLPPIAPQGTELSDIVRLRDQCAEAIAAHIDEPRLYAADISVPGAED